MYKTTIKVKGTQHFPAQDYMYLACRARTAHFHHHRKQRVRQVCVCVVVGCVSRAVAAVVWSIYSVQFEKLGIFWVLFKGKNVYGVMVGFSGVSDRFART